MVAQSVRNPLADTIFGLVSDIQDKVSSVQYLSKSTYVFFKIPNHKAQSEIKVWTTRRMSGALWVQNHRTLHCGFKEAAVSTWPPASFCCWPLASQKPTVNNSFFVLKTPSLSDFISHGYLAQAQSSSSFWVQGGGGSTRLLSHQAFMKVSRF